VATFLGQPVCIRRIILSNRAREVLSTKADCNYRNSTRSITS